MKSYKLYYERETKKPVPEDYDIHHIDGDRTNDHISNLVAIPRELHRRYHSTLKRYNLTFKFNPTVHLNGMVLNEHIIKIMNDLNEIINECQCYLAYRNVLLGQYWFEFLCPNNLY